MKILVISDSHGHIANLKHVMGFGEKIGVDAVIHCGDWDNVESVETVISFNIPLYAVLGNADTDSLIADRLRTTAKRYNAEFLEIELSGRKIGVTHKPSDNKKFFAGKKLDIIFNGHLHSKFDEVFQGIKLVRPGAIMKGTNFAVYETTTNAVSIIDSSLHTN